MKSRFLHYYQLMENNVDWIWCSYLLVFPIPTSFYVSRVRTGTINHHSISIGLPICSVSTLLLTSLDLFFIHSCCLGASLAKWLLLWALVLKKQRFPFWFGDQDSELGWQTPWSFRWLRVQNTGHPPPIPGLYQPERIDERWALPFSNCAPYLWISL